jgi:gluconolactonase
MDADPLVPGGGAGGSGGQGGAGQARGPGMTAPNPEGPPDLSIAGSSGTGGNDASGAGGTPQGNGGSGEAMDAAAPPSAVCPPGPFAASPRPAGATVETVCDGMTFTEGAVWFAERNTLFFSDFQIGGAMNFGGQILSHTPGGGCEPFIANAGTNGLAIAPDGNLLGCRHSDQTLTIFDLETLAPTVLIPDNGGLSFNSPNDVAVRSDGNMYFTDPTYLLGGRPSEQPARAYRRDPSGTLTVIDQGANTNGITLSPDESLLYLAHLGGGQNNIIVFDVDDAGAVSNQRPFANVGSDGMGIDCAGNLYVTQGGVRIYAPNGDLIDTIEAPGAANVAFGGPERRTLFITAQDSLLSIELAIPGLPY